jgi:outer membrane protein OmpA-like peptidoglycan-associated protein
VQAVLKKWWWLPVVMLGLLLLMAWIVAGLVQGRAQALAADAAGISEDRVEMVDGLNVRLNGFTDEASMNAAVAAVAELDSSWEVVGVVDGGSGDDGDGSELAGTAGATTSAPTDAGTAGGDAAQSGLAPPAVRLQVSPDGAVVATGTVADEARRIVVISETEDQAGAGMVTDQLVVDPDAVTAAGGSLTIEGAALSDAQRQVWVDGASTIAVAAGLQLVDEVTVDADADPEAADGDAVEDAAADGDAVEDAAADGEDEGEDLAAGLNELFELEPIEFGYNTAVIEPASAGTLDAAAVAINAAPEMGVLVVVGHTDSDGDPDANLRLSQARAEAVVTYLVEVGGVDAARLEAIGRGETDLKIDPETSSIDKQRNRRIEWERVE